MNEPFKTTYKALFYLLCITYQSVIFIAMRGQIITLNKIDYYPSYKQKNWSKHLAYPSH